MTPLTTFSTLTASTLPDGVRERKETKTRDSGSVVRHQEGGGRQAPQSLDESDRTGLLLPGSSITQSSSDSPSRTRLLVMSGLRGLVGQSISVATTGLISTAVSTMTEAIAQSFETDEARDTVRMMGAGVVVLGACAFDQLVTSQAVRHLQLKWANPVGAGGAGTQEKVLVKEPTASSTRLLALVPTALTATSTVLGTLMVSPSKGLQLAATSMAWRAGRLSRDAFTQAMKNYFPSITLIDSKSGKVLDSKAQRPTKDSASGWTTASYMGLIGLNTIGTSAALREHLANAPTPHEYSERLLGAIGPVLGTLLTECLDDVAGAHFTLKFADRHGIGARIDAASREIPEDWRTKAKEHGAMRALLSGIIGDIADIIGSTTTQTEVSVIVTALRIAATGLTELRGKNVAIGQKLSDRTISAVLRQLRPGIIEAAKIDGVLSDRSRKEIDETFAGIERTFKPGVKIADVEHAVQQRSQWLLPSRPDESDFPARPSAVTFDGKGEPALTPSVELATLEPGSSQVEQDGKASVPLQGSKDDRLSRPSKSTGTASVEKEDLNPDDPEAIYVS